MPGNPFREQLDRMSNPFRAKLEESQGPSAPSVAGTLAARGATNALLATPSASGKLMADALAALRAGTKHAAGFTPRVFHALRGTEHGQPSLSERYAAERDNPLMTAMSSIPRPTIQGAGAALKSVPSLLPGGETPGQAYDRNLSTIEAEETQMREAHPTAAMVGDVGGDVGALLFGRKVTGLGGAVRRVETALGGKAAIEVADSLADDLGKVLKGPTMQRLARGAGRSLETGVEAAALDILKDENADPIETAALAAGGQLVGSGFIGGAQGLMSGGPMKAGLKISVAAASTWGLLQLLKSATPGGQDRILESIETGYDKVALALGVGAASAALGATRYGRGNTALSDQTRAFLDGLATTHRGTTLSLLTDWTEGDASDQATIERVLTAAANDSSYEGETEAERSIVRRLKRSLQTGGRF